MEAGRAVLCTETSLAIRRVQGTLWLPKQKYPIYDRTNCKEAVLLGNTMPDVIQLSGGAQNRQQQVQDVDLPLHFFFSSM